MSEGRTFPFPAEPTRRERMTFEQQSGRTFTEMAEILGNPARHVEFTVLDEAALLFMAVKRKRPDVTFDEVVDHDDWSLEVGLEVADDDPLPPPAQS